ncbi:M1 family metallopeptidase [Panacibacter ginsenosidivorans]|uniref:M1 family metallopeptidase n=1 Tax=Panacibacter ginsenosidivorans TaxID=1813871 RepID=A0A5B8VBU0_9BACT|nr:M1 family metallopeptidase [Panacibacter ginsenosidivorans]QEC67738.1 M1 family metallopeptidase [Panacibacter ginsenosidivorans]
MKHLLLICSLIACSVAGANAQALYMPREVKEAFKKETRSIDGKPGKNYWQNYGRYNITVTAAPPDRNIKGSETIMYVNNSTDTIRNPVIKLFLNIHKPGAPRNFGVGADYLTDGVQIDKVTVNNQPYQWRNNPNAFTFQSMRLPKPLAPHDSIQLMFDWHYEISLQSNREGMIDSTTYFLAYFYPRVAVFDDISGWDRMNFMDSHEFYSDFNDYTVTLNVPKNYIVWGTGTLNNPERLLQPDFLKKYYSSFTSDETIHVATKEDLAAKRVTAQDNMNSWKFTANNIPDMAFGLSDHFVWDAGSVLVDDATKRRASVQAAYNDTAADYRNMVEYGKHSLDWLSHNWPGIPYPYEKTTIFQGYAGMEYPMMANDETYEDPNFSRFVAEHEIAHTYMPFYMGINETRYGFMDEGWATTFELLIGRADLGVEKAESLYKQFRIAGWIGDPSAGEDIPIVTPGDALTGQGFGNNEYGKASIGYLAMKDLLGDQLFKTCLHAYMNRWNGKHPIPWDFFNTFNNISGQDLNWFWNSWYFSNNYIDFAVQSVNKNKNSYAVAIQNIGGYPAPFDLVITYDDGSSEKQHQTPMLWKADLKNASVNITTKKKIKSVQIDGGIFMDADESNNTFNVQ